MAAARACPFEGYVIMIFDDRFVGEILDISLRAGRAILEVYSRDFDVDSKADDSPLTEADRAAHGIIVRDLAALEVDGRILPVLSEEGDMPSAEVRRSWDDYWLVDPLDGTKEFVKRNGEFTVNIALMRRRVPTHSGTAGGEGAGAEPAWYPVFGAVYAPVLDEAYVGYDDGEYRQALRVRGLNEGGNAGPSGGPGGRTDSDDWKAASRPIRAASVFPDEGQGVKVVASRSHLNAETEAFIARLEKTGRIIETANSGSSLKLCRVASGEAQAYPRFAPTMEWDTAAADGVCRGAGARVLNAETGNPLVYNKDNLLNPHFLVTGIREIEELL
jgi:3'(2'), 5'-bisphosphate nucleotidase